jgi:hypothetical protein
MHSFYKLSIAAVVFGMVMISSVLMAAEPGSPHVPVGVVSDWTNRHVLYPESKDAAVMARIQKDPRWQQNWYLRHKETWWPDHRRGPRDDNKARDRDWSVSLSSSPLTSGFEPVFNFSFTIGPDTGYGSLITTDIGNGAFLATAGTLTVTGGSSGYDLGTYLLYPGGPGEVLSPTGFFLYDNIIYPSVVPWVDNGGLFFVCNEIEYNGYPLELNIYSVGSDILFYLDNGYNDTATGGESLTGTVAPGGGQTSPAKYVFDVTAAPSCTNDYVVIGIPAAPASGGQANILGMNNLYSYQGTPPHGLTPECTTNGPTTMFAYASGSGQVPAGVAISWNGKQLAYIENLLTGSSYFHVLTIGTTANEGTSATAAVVPGTGGSNAVDQSVLLSPDGGTTNQSSTNSVFVNYAAGVAYATTFSTLNGGSGYLYKIGNVFNGSAAPTIIWSIAINSPPSTPVYDWVSNKIFFTDASGRIDYVTDNGASPSVVAYGAVLAPGTTSQYPVLIDSSNQMVYATFNSNGINAVVVQAPTSMASSVSVPVGTANTVYTAPYSPDFNNAWYTGTGTPLMYVAGTGAGALPTLYSVGFNASGVLNSSANATTAALTSGTADSSAVTEFYNAALGKDYLFVGVTNYCIAVNEGGNAGCVMSLDITDGFPTVNANTIALAAAGGTSGIIVDNDSSVTEAANIYYATKTAATMVKATQTGLN